MPELLCRRGAEHSSPTVTTMTRFNHKYRVVFCGSVIVKCCHKILQGILGFVVQPSIGRPPRIWAVSRACFQEGCFMCEGSPYCGSLFPYLPYRLHALQSILVDNCGVFGEDLNGENRDFQSPVCVRAVLLNYRIGFLGLRSSVALIIFVWFLPSDIILMIAGIGDVSLPECQAKIIFCFWVLVINDVA